LAERLYQQIGELKVELDWLKKKIRAVPLVCSGASLSLGMPTSAFSVSASWWACPGRPGTTSPCQSPR
jgi:hypothetical protein